MPYTIGEVRVAAVAIDLYRGTSVLRISSWRNDSNRSRISSSWPTRTTYALGMGYLTNLFSNLYDSAVGIVNLLFSGLLDQLPDLRLRVADGTRFIPHPVGHLGHGHRVRSETRRLTKKTPEKLLRRLFFDILTFSSLALCYLVDLVLRVERVLGTAVPFDMGDEDPLMSVGGVPHLVPPRTRGDDGRDGAGPFGRG